MKSPQMFRPMLLVGMILIVLAVFSWLMIPSWSSSLLGVIGIILAILLGLVAVVRDLINLGKEVKKMDQNRPK